MRKILILISLFLLILITFSSTYDVRSVEDLSYVLALGIDISDSQEEPLLLSIQIAKPDFSEGGGTKITSEVQTVKCNSFNLGMALLNLENVSELNLSHCSAIVISEEVARNDIEMLMSTISNNIEIRPTCNVLISQTSASELLTQASKIEDISAKFYNSFINSARNTSYVTPCKLSSFYAAASGDVKEPVAVYSFIENDMLESLGLAAFKNNKMVGRLSGVDTLCYNLLTNNFDRAAIEIYSQGTPDYPLTVNISRSKKPKISVSLENNTPKIKCEINVEAKLLTANKNIDITQVKTQEQITSEINKFLQEHILDLLYKTSLEYQSDIIGFKGYFNRNFLTQDELDKYNWDKLYPKAEFYVEANTFLDHGSLFSKD